MITYYVLCAYLILFGSQTEITSQPVNSFFQI